MKNTNFEILEKEEMTAITGGKWRDWIEFDDDGDDDVFYIASDLDLSIAVEFDGGNA